MSLLQIQDKWIKTKFSDIALTVNENEFNPLQNGIQKYVGGEHIESENLYVTKFGDIKTNKHVLGSAFHRRFFKGDILFGTRRAYLRKAAIATFDGICANTTLVLRSKNNYFVKRIITLHNSLGKIHRIRCIQICRFYKSICKMERFSCF